jgi:hypothetical protein
MAKKHKQASKPITNEEEAEVSDSQKKHYAKLGYKPYLSTGGKIKWLSYEQHIYEKIKYSRKSSLLFKHFKHPRRRNLSKYGKSLFRILSDNWFIVLACLLIIISLIFIDKIISIISQV